jgi:protocatechuate 3,4-dioxygenase beta subunit
MQFNLKLMGVFMNDLSRRKFFKMSLATAAGVAAGSSVLAQTVGAACGLTPPQTPGPFYPERDQADKDNDLTVVRGGVAPATGQRIYLLGQVLDEACDPVLNAQVEIWQACASGKYNHSLDDNPAPLDKNFQYWGKAVTDAQGQYSFKTILPGAYPADVNWTRPPHIHFKVQRLGYHELVTQMYFGGQSLNDVDLILQSIPASQRPSVIIPMELPNSNMEPDSRVCHFNITLKRVAAL